jgi:glutamate-1-semialdehyde aminotransferase
LPRAKDFTHPAQVVIDRITPDGPVFRAGTLSGNYEAGFVSSAHTDADIAASVAAAGRVLAGLK